MTSDWRPIGEREAGCGKSLKRNGVVMDAEGTLQPELQPGAGLSLPSGELPASGRDGRGRFTAHNLAAFVHGGRSEQVRQALLPEQADGLTALAERRQELERDLGGHEHLSLLTRDMLGRYLELGLIGDYLAANILEHGVLTKGRQRAAVSAFAAIVDRQQRLAQVLGLARRVKTVADLSITEYLEHTRPQQHPEGSQQP